MYCDIDSRSFPRSYAASSEVHRVEREELMVGGDRIRVEGHGRVGEVHAVCYAARRNRRTTIAGKLIASDFFHELWLGRFSR